MVVLYGLVGIAVIVVLATWLYIENKGNAQFVVKNTERSEFKLVAQSQKSITLQCEAEIANEGKQCGTIMDCYSRHLMPYEYFDGVEVNSRIQRKDALREDDYFESFIIYQRSKAILIVEVELIARKDESIKDTLVNMVDMPIDIVYQMVTRKDWHIEKSRIELKASEVAQAVGITLA